LHFLIISFTLLFVPIIALMKGILKNSFSFLYLFHFFLATGKEKQQKVSLVKDFFENETVGRRCWTCRTS
jgi:hypothetical protein